MTTWHSKPFIICFLISLSSPVTPSSFNTQTAWVLQLLVVLFTVSFHAANTFGVPFLKLQLLIYLLMLRLKCSPLSLSWNIIKYISVCNQFSVLTHIYRQPFSPSSQVGRQHTITTSCSYSNELKIFFSYYRKPFTVKIN